MLTNGVNGNGAEIALGRGIVVDIFNNQLDGQPEWVLTVHDDDQKISWFDVLLRFDFMGLVFGKLNRVRNYLRSIDFRLEGV
ncbi:hypothetical protein L3X07_10360 [Levilactobacillus brevis]|nr:hypothetical protein [Levilactobacillus brevis]